MSKTLNTTFAQSKSLPTQPLAIVQQGYLLARVTHVVIGPFYANTDIQDPYYSTPTDIGTITYQLLQKTQSKTKDSKGNPPAKPVNSAVKHMPVEGEIVFLVPGPSVRLNDSAGQQDYYYFNPFNIWNASHHNAFPDIGDLAEFSNSTNRSYEQTLNTNQPSNLSVTQSNNYPLNPLFTEKSNIKTLLSFVGDLTIEGYGSDLQLLIKTLTDGQEKERPVIQLL